MDPVNNTNAMSASGIPIEVSSATWASPVVALTADVSRMTFIGVAATASGSGCYTSPLKDQSESSGGSAGEPALAPSLLSKKGVVVVRTSDKLLEAIENLNFPTELMALIRSYRAPRDNALLLTEIYEKRRGNEANIAGIDVENLETQTVADLFQQMGVTSFEQLQKNAEMAIKNHLSTQTVYYFLDFFGLPWDPHIEKTIPLIQGRITKEVSQYESHTQLIPLRMVLGQFAIETALILKVENVFKNFLLTNYYSEFGFGGKYLKYSENNVQHFTGPLIHPGKPLDVLPPVRFDEWVNLQSCERFGVNVDLVKRVRLLQQNTTYTNLQKVMSVAPEVARSWTAQQEQAIDELTYALFNFARGEENVKQIADCKANLLKVVSEEFKKASAKSNLDPKSPLILIDQSLIDWLLNPLMSIFTKPKPKPKPKRDVEPDNALFGWLLQKAKIQILKQIHEVVKDQRYSGNVLVSIVANYVDKRCPESGPNLRDQLTILFLVKLQIAFDQVLVELQGDMFRQKLAELMVRELFLSANEFCALESDPIKDTVRAGLGNGWFSPDNWVKSFLNKKYQTLFPYTSSKFMHFLEIELNLDRIRSTALWGDGDRSLAGIARTFSEIPETRLHKTYETYENVK